MSSLAISSNNTESSNVPSPVTGDGIGELERWLNDDENVDPKHRMKVMIIRCVLPTSKTSVLTCTLSIINVLTQPTFEGRDC